MTTIKKLAKIANSALKCSEHGPALRVSASGKNLFVKWENFDSELKYSIPANLAVDMLTALVNPDQSIHTQSRVPCLNSDYVLFSLGAII